MTDESRNDDNQDRDALSPRGLGSGPGRGGSSSGVSLVSLAGIVLVANYAIFELIFQEYFLSYPLLLLAVVAVLLPRLRQESVEAFHPLGSLMKVVGYGIVILGVAEILDDIRFDGYDDAGSVIGALAAYAGYVMAFLGARSIRL